MRPVQAAAAPADAAVKAEDTRMIQTSGKPKVEKKAEAMDRKKSPASREEQPIGIGR